ncbi:MAG: hypothetical protein AVDCRST_MAG37-2715, partial [uncultured Rubrobacteraceae bacterium]
ALCGRSARDPSSVRRRRGTRGRGALRRPERARSAPLPSARSQGGDQQHKRGGGLGSSPRRPPALRLRYGVGRTRVRPQTLPVQQPPRVSRAPLGVVSLGYEGIQAGDEPAI